MTFRPFLCVSVAAVLLLATAGAVGDEKRATCVTFKYTDRCDLRVVARTYLHTGAMVSTEVQQLHRTFRLEEYTGRSEEEHMFMLRRPDLAYAPHMAYSSIYAPASASCMSQLDTTLSRDTLCFVHHEPSRFAGVACTRYYNDTDHAYYVSADNELLALTTPTGYTTLRYDATVTYDAALFAQSPLQQGCLAPFYTPPPLDVFRAACNETDAAPSPARLDFLSALRTFHK